MLLKAKFEKLKVTCILSRPFKQYSSIKFHAENGEMMCHKTDLKIDKKDLNHGR